MNKFVILMVLMQNTKLVTFKLRTHEILSSYFRLYSEQIIRCTICSTPVSDRIILTELSLAVNFTQWLPVVDPVGYTRLDNNLFKCCAHITVRSD